MQVDELPCAYQEAAAAFPAVLRDILLKGVTDCAADDLRAALSTLPLSLPVGRAVDVLQRPALLPPATCAQLRAVADLHAGTGGERDTVDGAADHQVNLTGEELTTLLGREQVDAILAAGRELDLHCGGSGHRALPLVEAFVRRYTAATRPWHPFHQDRAAVTVNCALSDDRAHCGGRLVGLFEDGVEAFERSEGTATVHRSCIVHGVTRMQSGTRYSLICFLGDEPSVRRELVVVCGADGVERHEWTRTIVTDP